MLPTAMMNKEGKIITSSEEIKRATMEHYKEVLKNRTIKPHLQEYKEDREKLFKQRIQIASKNITLEWSVVAIQNLKKHKSCDQHGIPHELLQGGCSGVTLAVTNLMTGIKKQQEFPQCLQTCNVTSLYKNKVSKKDFNQYRGIFRVSVFRNILDRLIFNDEYIKIDFNLTDSNVGGRGAEI